MPGIGALHYPNKGTTARDDEVFVSADPHAAVYVSSYVAMLDELALKLDEVRNNAQPQAPEQDASDIPTCKPSDLKYDVQSKVDVAGGNDSSHPASIDVTGYAVNLGFKTCVLSIKASLSTKSQPDVPVMTVASTGVNPLVSYAPRGADESHARVDEYVLAPLDAIQYNGSVSCKTGSSTAEGEMDRILEQIERPLSRPTLLLPVDEIPSCPAQ